MLARIPDLNAIDQGAGTRFADVGSGYWGFYEVTEATTNHEYTRSSNTAREVWTSLNAIDQGAGTRFADVGSGYWGFYEVTEATTNHEYTRSSNTAREVWTSWESSKAS